MIAAGVKCINLNANCDDSGVFIKSLKSGYLLQVQNKLQQYKCKSYKNIYLRITVTTDSNNKLYSHYHIQYTKKCLEMDTDIITVKPVFKTT